MPPQPRSKKRSAPSPPPTSRAKKPKPKTSAKKANAEPASKGEEEDEVPGGGARDKDGEEFWALSDKRRVSINTWRGHRQVAFREYYEKDGELLPTKKGISLSVEQFNTLISFLPHIETVLVHKYGERDLARPSYSPREGDGDTRTSKGAGAEDAKEAKEEKYDDIDDEVADDSSERKKNFEATSDEE